MPNKQVRERVREILRKLLMVKSYGHSMLEFDTDIDQALLKEYEVRRRKQPSL